MNIEIPTAQAIRNLALKCEQESKERRVQETLCAIRDSIFGAAEKGLYNTVVNRPVGEETLEEVVDIVKQIQELGYRASHEYIGNHTRLCFIITWA